MFKYLSLFFVFIAFVQISAIFAQTQRPIVIGSKAFTEGYILAELMAQKLEQKGFVVERRFGMGGTGILFEALVSDVIDIYPEYTGTIATSLLDTPLTSQDHGILQSKLLDMGYHISQSFGFNNTYALAMREDIAEDLQISQISDLRNHPQLVVAFSHEFLNRSDGYLGLQQVYGLDFVDVTGIEHALAYEALSSDKIALTDIYSTDAKVKSLKLRVLEDDLHFFPQYLPVALVKTIFRDKFPEAWAVIKDLEDTISVSAMIDLNSRVDIDKASYQEAVTQFIQPLSVSFQADSLARRIMQRTQEHLFLVLLALLIALVIGFPLGVLATEHIFLERVILNVTSVMQTVPSLVLLCFLIPLFGIGEVSALVALILYGLLPIVINTFTGLRSIDHRYQEVACGLGLSWWESLLYIKIPMASPSILAGIKTSVIIGIGTATLSALIGAGGYGRPIMRGLALNDTATILEGAIPAAMLALLLNFALEKLNKKCIPVGLQGIKDRV